MATRKSKKSASSLNGTATSSGARPHKSNAGRPKETTKAKKVAFTDEPASQPEVTKVHALLSFGFCFTIDFVIHWQKQDTTSACAETH